MPGPAKGSVPGAIGGGTVLIAVLIAAFNLRIGIAAIGPLLEEIRLDTGMSSTIAGALTTVPFLCMGLFAFLGGPLIHRLGTKRVITIGLALILFGTLTRAWAPGAIWVLAATLPIGVGVALVGVALPVVVKLAFRNRPGIATGAYVASLSLGMAAVGVILVPLAEAIGGWREAFTATALPAAIGLAAWSAAATGPLRAEPDIGTLSGVGAPGQRPAEDAGDLRPARDGRGRRLAGALPRRGPLMLGVVFGLQSLCFATMIGWAPAIYADGGWSVQKAGLATTAIGLCNIVGALGFSSISHHGDRRVWLTVSLATQTLGIAGLAVAGTTMGWLWLALFALGNGASFATLLTLPIDLSDSPRTVADVTVWMLGVGYLISALGPFAVGALRDATSSFGLALALLVAISVATVAMATVLPRRIQAHEVTRSGQWSRPTVGERLKPPENL